MHWRCRPKNRDVLVEVAHDLVSHIFDAGSAAAQRSDAGAELFQVRV